MIPPYHFYPAFRNCPRCGGGLATIEPVEPRSLRGPLARMGLTCFCGGCGARYRAFPGFPLAWVHWLGPAGRRFWWKKVRLQTTTPALA
ncbi:MAG: hypothetical protein COV76_00160 [Candidatus Omnitrophica bacterium CG11_big_fil_rev_8_21_14_0_20_64_10]|nr:MAG: hypothetical protein COV76_00160 [Candidatus Omnitrophica bacterium CG11_big_fil_rev_8_21_14_0_20_64_10]